MTQARIHLADDLSQRLFEDITWRIREISAFKRSIDLADAIRVTALRRASVPLLYAHWEGFFAAASTAYLSFVASHRLKTDQLKPNFWAVLKMRAYQPDAIKRDIDVYRLLCELRQSDEETFKSGRFYKITAKSNLNSKVLTEGCELLGISSESFRPYVDFIDKTLIDKRNFIAHGESNAISSEEFNDLREKVIELMRLLQAEIENCAYRGSFKS